jgi:hypothetical protein
MSILIESWKPLAALFGLMIGVLELGRYLGNRHRRADPDGHGRGGGTFESTVMALLGLMLAFAFSGAWARFDARRELILKEANAIGTAWLRLDLLPGRAREELRESFRRYVDVRLEVTQRGEATPSAAVNAAQQAIWSSAVGATQATPDTRAALLLLPALNDMFDVAGARYVAVQAHAPALVFVMLLVLMLLAALLAGYGMAGGKKRHWLHAGCFVLSLMLAVYVTLDLEYPRAGLIRVDSYDQILVDLRAGMK